MGWIILLIVVVLLILNQFFYSRNNFNQSKYEALPIEIQILIDEENVEKIVEILWGLELENEYQLFNDIMAAVDSKGFAFSIKIDKARKKIKEKNIL